MTQLLFMLQEFMARGGPVLWLIAALIFAIWALVFERLCFYRFQLPDKLQQVSQQWQARSEHHSWCAHRIREGLHSHVLLQIQRFIPLVSALVALGPLLGLLGTVTGMIEVFAVMALTDSSDSRAMADGIGRATIPAMAGMVAALSGFIAMVVLKQTSLQQERQLDHLLG